MHQEKLKTILMQNLFFCGGGGVGGKRKCIMGVANA